MWDEKLLEGAKQVSGIIWHFFQRSLTFVDEKWLQGEQEW